MQKLPRVEMAALLALVSLGTTGIGSANAAGTEADTMQVTEHQLLAAKGKDGGCGEGSCGTDKKGMKAAKEKNAAKEKVSTHKGAEKKDGSGGASSSDTAKSTESSK
jgi:uncharacterized low-complexity protein